LKAPYALFVGRFRGEFHEGHQWLIAQKLEQGPVLIAVLDAAAPDSPHSATHVVRTIKRFYKGRDVKVILIPDIESFNYGRDPGYAINYHLSPATLYGSQIRQLAGELQAFKQENAELRRELDERTGRRTR
jgi:nicotinamide mononucleotide adenylyltransferase